MQNVSSSDSYGVSALILCRDLANLPDWQQIMEAASQIHPEFAAGLYQINVPEAAQNEEICFAGAGHDQITCIFRNEPVPQALLEEALQMPRVKSEVAQTIEQHDSYIYLSLGDAGQSHSTILQGALSLTLLAASIVKHLGAPLIYWPTSKSLLFGETLEEVAKRIDTGQLPLELWVNLIPSQIEDISEDTALHMLETEGLLPFVGYEIEFTPSTLQQKHLAIHTLAVATAILLDGTDTLVDGDIIGQENDNIRLRIKEEGSRPGIPVIELSQEHL